MSLAVWNPVRELDEILNKLSRVPAGDNNIWGETLASADWMPAVDIRETDAEYQIELELPQISPEAVQVTFRDGVLGVTGERKFEKETQGKVHRVERRYGRFARSFRLPETADENRIEARARDGVLYLTIAKREEVKPKTIQVQVSS